MDAISPEYCKTARASQIAFNKFIAPYRKDLFKFCRSLTIDPWDAEDLAQETLLKVYGRLGDRHIGIENPKSYLFRAASNQWIDWCRRKNQTSNLETDKAISETVITSFEVRDAMIAVARTLPPKEQVAFILKEVFETELDEIAEIVGTTTGAVKSALHRAREKMGSEKPKKATEMKLNQMHKELVDQLVDAFNRRNIEDICKLFLSSASSNCYGCFTENNLEEIKKGSLFYTVNQQNGKPQPKEYEGRSVVVAGEPLFIQVSHGVLTDIWKFRFSEGKISHFDCYYTSPNVLAELAELLNLKPGYNGYFYEECHSK